jgi:hypothetical protein
VRIGENYNKSVDTDGQVLSLCCADVMRMYDMKNGNKLSLLLPAPAPTPAPTQGTARSVWDEDDKVPF